MSENPTPRPEVDPRRNNLQARPFVFNDDDFLPDYAEPGVFELVPAHGVMILACPGCGRVQPIKVGNPKPEKTPSWLLTGTPEAPTLHPSIDCQPCCKWHGWLRNGLFTLK